jgi:competence protein ComEC
MTLGWRTALTEDVSRSFVESGTMHVFAISGLHIALLAGVMVAMLRLCRVDRSIAGGVVVPALWFYVAATGWQPSAVRSAVMTTVVVGSWMLRRPGDGLNSLALAAVIILVADPGQ